MENEWIVVDRYSNDVWPCTTEEEANNTAEDILIDYWDSGDHEGVPEDVLHGAIVIAKVVAQSAGGGERGRYHQGYYRVLSLGISIS